VDTVKTLLDRADQYRIKRAGYDDRHQEYSYCAPFCPTEQMPVGAALVPGIAVFSDNTARHGAWRFISKGVQHEEE
jgi:hypothetical protein